MLSGKLSRGLEEKFVIHWRKSEEEKPTAAWIASARFLIILFLLTLKLALF